MWDLRYRQDRGVRSVVSIGLASAMGPSQSLRMVFDLKGHNVSQAMRCVQILGVVRFRRIRTSDESEICIAHFRLGICTIMA